MSTQTCSDHGETVIVYQGTAYTQCPLCLSEGQLDDAKSAIADLKDQLADQDQTK